MVNKQYTDTQTQNARRMAKAISGIAKDDFSMYAVAMNALLLGADMAAAKITPGKEYEETQERETAPRQAV